MTVGGRGAGSFRVPLGALALLAPWLLVAARAAASPDDAATAWDEAPRRPPPASAGRPFPRPLQPVVADDDGPTPVFVEVDPGGALARELAALAEARRPDEVVRAARARALDPLARARLVRDPGGGAALLGAQEAARRVVDALPGELLAAARPTWDLELEASGLRSRGTDAAARDLLTAFPQATAAPDVARWLGERCLERGDVEDALLYFRRALALGPAPAVARTLQARLVGLRARPGAALGLPAPPPPALDLVWARCASAAPIDAACDDARVFALYPDRLLALARRDGRVRWAVGADLAGDGDPDARVVLGHDLVLLVGRAALRAFAPDDGAVRWSVTLEALRTAAGADDPTDRFVGAAATPDGFVALLTLGGGRRVVALDLDGAARWSTPLWPAREGGEAVTPVRAVSAPAHVDAVSSDGRVATVAPGPGGEAGRRASCPAPGADGVSTCGAPLVRGVRCPVCGYDAEPDVTVMRLEVEPRRAAAGDGRLACVADRVLLTADGLVAALGLAQGEVLWTLDRGPGLGLGGRRWFVSLRADAAAVEAVTAAGLLVRLDPLDGALLPPRAAPPDAPREQQDEGPRVLAPGPLVLGWPRGDGGLRAGAALLGAERRPMAPGVVLRGRALVVPVAEGLLTVDVATGEALGRVAWPLGAGGAGRRRLAAAPDGFVAAWGPDGLAAFAPGAPAPGPAPAPLAPEAPVEALLRALDHADWRLRLDARRALVARQGAAAGALRAAVAAPGATAEVREVAGQLLAREGLRARWRQVAPAAPDAALEPLLDGELGPAALAAIAPHVAAGPEAATALVSFLPEARDLEARAALIDLALHAHELLCGRVVAIIRNAQANPPLMLAAAEYLVDLARRGLEQPVRRALVHPDQITRASVQAVLLTRADDALREHLRGDPAYWDELRKNDLVAALGVQLLGVEPDRGALIDELTRALLP